MSWLIKNAYFIADAEVVIDALEIELCVGIISYMYICMYVPVTRCVRIYAMML